VDRKVVMLTKDRLSAQDVQKRMLEMHKVSVEIFVDVADLLDGISSGKLGEDCYYLDDTIKDRDIRTLLDFIQRSGLSGKVLLFVAANDADYFTKLLEAYPKLGLTLINMPASEKEIVTRLQQKLQYDKSVKKPDTKYSLNTSFMKVILDCTEQALSEMLGDASISHEKPQLSYEFKENEEIKLRAQITINSNLFRGSYFMSFPEKTYLNMYEKVVGEKYNTIEEANYDLVKELANIIYGRAKSILNADEKNLSVAIPSHYNVMVESTDIVIIIPYRSRFGSFFVKIAPNLF